MNKNQIHLFIKTQKKTGLNYLGITTKDPYSYKGSGTDWKKHIKLHGRKPEDIITKVLYSEDMILVGKKFTSSKEFRKFCIETSDLYNIVENESFANLQVEDGCPGAYGNGEVQRKENKIKQLHEYDNVIEFKEKEWTKKTTEYNDTSSDKYSPSEPITKDSLSKIVENLMSEYLSKREIIILKMRYGIEYFIKTDYSGGEFESFESIGRRFDITGDRVGQIHNKALRKLRKPAFAHKLQNWRVA